VDEAVEAVVSVDFADAECRGLLLPSRWLEVQRAVRPLGVVMRDEHAQHAFEVAAVDDQQNRCASVTTRHG
jgi:hypothetical protein